MIPFSPIIIYFPEYCSISSTKLGLVKRKSSAMTCTNWQSSLTWLYKTFWTSCREERPPCLSQTNFFIGKLYLSKKSSDGILLSSVSNLIKNSLLDFSSSDVRASKESNRLPSGASPSRMSILHENITLYIF